MKKPQNYANHGRIVPGFHLLLSLMLLLGFISALINVFRHPPNSGGFVSAVLIAGMFTCGMLLFWYSRVFPLRAQDRAIRAEENLRHYVLTGKLLDPRIDMQQAIALRFASDEEFIALAKKAAEENMAPKDIKAAIVKWRADHHRA